MDKFSPHHILSQLSLSSPSSSSSLSPSLSPTSPPPSSLLSSLPSSPSLPPSSLPSSLSSSLPLPPYVSVPTDLSSFPQSVSNLSSIHSNFLPSSVSLPSISSVANKS